jgi:hypothetical protein
MGTPIGLESTYNTLRYSMTKDKAVRWVVLEKYQFRDDLIGYSTLVSVHKNIKDAGKVVLKYTDKNCKDYFEKGKDVEVCEYEISLSWSPSPFGDKDPDNKVYKTIEDAGKVFL